MATTTFAASEVLGLLTELANQEPHHTRPAAPSSEAARAVSLRLRLRLGRSESRLLAKLMDCECATKPELHAAISPDKWTAVPDSKVVDVTLCHLRKKLAPWGVEVCTVHGVGVRLADGAQDKLHKILAGHDAASEPKSEVTTKEPATAKRSSPPAE